MNGTRQRRRGMTSVLAMLYLVLFSTLAVGFYAATNTASQVTANDEHVTRAFLAAESGMDFMRYQLAHVHILPNTAPSMVIDQLYSDLQHELNGTGNLGGYTIARTGNTITIPGDPGGSVKLDPGGESTFRATITDWAGEIVVKIDGRHGTGDIASRSITMDFTRQQLSTSIFNYAVASKGQIVVSKGELTSVPGVDPAVAAIMSASRTVGAVTVTGGLVGGDISVLKPDLSENLPGGAAVVTGGSVGGSSVSSNILKEHVHPVDPPEFPTIDPTVYKQYATNSFTGAKTQKNILIKAGTNPKFNANDTVQGIMYIESPNQVTFNGDFKLQGFIVMESSGSTNDTLEFSGNLTMSPLPASSQFDPLRATSGVAILAPNAAVSMTGSSGGNVKGNIIVKRYSFSGSSNLEIDQGTLMTLDPNDNSCVINTSKSVKFSAPGATNQPKLGLSYSTYYSPNPGTYQEVTP